MEGKDDRLDDTYYKPNPIQVPVKTRDNPIETCYDIARDKGYNYFGVNNGGWCLGSYDAEFTFKVQGKATSCKDGRGGQWMSDVYFIIREASTCFDFYSLVEKSSTIIGFFLKIPLDYVNT